MLVSQALHCKHNDAWAICNPDGYRKYGLALPHGLIYPIVKPLKTGIVLGSGLVEENGYHMEI